jgi:hypothetical protein
MHCWCPPATGPGQPHLSGCSHFKRPAVPSVTQAFIGSYHDWDLLDPDEPIDVVKKYLPEPQYMKIDPEAWTFGKMAAKMIADATAAAESTGGQGELPAAELLPEPVSLIEFGPQQLSQKEKQALAYVQAHAMQLAYNQAQLWADKQKPQSFVHSVAPVEILTVSEIKAAFEQAYTSLKQASDKS